MSGPWLQAILNCCNQGVSAQNSRPKGQGALWRFCSERRRAGHHSSRGELEQIQFSPGHASVRNNGTLSGRQNKISAKTKFLLLRFIALCGSLVKPPCRSNSWKRGSFRSESYCGSTLIWVRAGERSRYPSCRRARTLSLLWR